MASNFKTRKEAQTEADKRNGPYKDSVKVWHLERHIPKKKRKMKRPYFVGHYIEWLNR